MSSGVETRPAKGPNKSPKFVAVIDENLGQAQRKIRLGDLARGLLALTALTFGYLLAAVTFDLATGGTSFLVTAIRVGLFGVFAVLFVLFGGWTLARYLTRVNPYFAARRLEETIPDSKNSLINWLDLRDNAQIPPAIYQAVGLRAAKDVEAADPELVVSTKETTRLGITIGVLALGLGLMFLFVPHQFRALLGRAMMPFAAAPVPPPTVITLLRPASGDAVVAANQRVDILALIEGQIADAGTPEAPALYFRNDPTDVFQRVPLEENKDGWGVRLTPEQIRSGLTYKLTAGLASTPEHRLTVRTQPFVSKFDVTYRYRAYRKVRPETVVFPNVTAHEPSFLGHHGTEVDLTIHANTPIAKGYLDFDSAGKRWLEKGVPVPEDPKALRFRFPLERSGTVRVEFEAPGGERNLDRDPYELRVLDDDAPAVKLVEPGKDLSAPANGTLLLVGKAYDDFGVTGLTLKVRVPGKKDAIAQPYRPGKSLQFKDGTYPLAIEYFDTLHLDRLQLAAGAELEYWLEATDNCDYQPHVGKSATYKLKLVTPDTDPQSQKSKSDKAEMQAKAGQKEQDDKNGQANSENGDDKNGNGPGDKGEGDQGNNKGGDKNGDKDGNKGGDKGGDKSGENGSGNQGSSPNQEKAHEDQLKKDLTKTGEPLAKELDKNGQKDQAADSNPKGNNSDGKSGDPKKDDAKSQGDNTKSDNSKSDNSASQEKKSGSASNDSKTNDPKSDGPGGSGDSKQPKGKDDPSKEKSSESGNATGSDGGSDAKKDESGKAKDDKAKGGDKGNEAQSGPKTVGSQPDKSPADSKASKTGNSGEAGTQKSTTKKDGAEKGEGPVGKDAETEAAKNPSAKAKAATADVKTPPGAKSTAAKDKKQDSASGKPPEPTREEIDTLGKLLKQKAPEADKMAKDLVQRGLDMTNDDNKKALQNTLKDAGRDDDLNTLNKEEKLPPPMPGDGNGNAQGPMPSKDGNEKAMAKGTGNKKGSDKKGEEPAANTGGGSGFEEKLKEITPDEEFKRRLGSLQIDDIEALKKRITKDVRVKAGVNDQEWQQFLKNAAEYKRLLDRHRPAARADAKTLTGGASKIAGQGPRRVDASPGAAQSSLEGGAVAPPPEFEDAQRAFTRGKRN